jgi:hypothetical protein
MLIRDGMNVPQHSVLPAGPRSGVRVGYSSIALALACGIGIVVAAVLETGASALFFASAGALAGCVGLAGAVRRMVPDAFAVWVLVIASALQSAWLLVLSLSGASTLVRASTFAPDLAASPVRLAVALLVIPVGTVAAVGFGRVAGMRTRSTERIARFLEVPLRDMRPFLMFGALLLPAYWVAAMPETGLIGYLVRVMAKFSLLFPFWAGRYSSQSVPLHLLWIVSLAINAAAGLLSGSRFVGLLPVALFAAGYISILPRKRRRSAAVLAGLVALVLIPMSGAVGMVRSEIGRGGIELLNLERAGQLASAVADALQSEASGLREATGAGIQRMLLLPNLVVVQLTPSVIPERGADGLAAELLSVFNVSLVSGRTDEDMLERGLGSAPAIEYGFVVTTETSVEFGVLADGWSRAGLPGALLYAFVFALVLLIVERRVHRVLRRHAPIALLLITALIQAALFESGRLPLLAALRWLLLALMFLLGVAIIIRWMVPTRSKAAR